MFEDDDLFEMVGTVDVDAGLIWIGDPCYIIRDNGEPRAEDLGANWLAFCKRFTDRSKGSGVAAFAHREGGRDGMGLAINTLYGDGTYPVFVERCPATGGVARIIIEFDLYSEDDE